LDLPWKDFDSRWDARNDYWRSDLALLGLLFRDDKTLAGRFSDRNHDPWGESGESFQESGTVSPEAKEALKFVIPSRYMTQMDVAPGSYTMKLVLTDGEQFGRVEVPIEVADYDRNKMALSSVILCKRFRKQAQPAGQGVERASKYAPLVSNGIEFTPTGDTRFHTSDAMAAYFEIYEPLLSASRGATRVRFRMRISDARTAEVKVDSGVRSADSYIRSGSSVIPVSQQIGLDKLSPGTYRLEVQASDSAGNQTDWRATSFAVE
jgi:hypothetical protein